MNTELFIANRLAGQTNKGKISTPVLKIARFGITLGIAVMVLAICILVAFKAEVTRNIIGFIAPIQLSNFDSNASFETVPVNKNQKFYETIPNIENVEHIQRYATKPGLIRTKDNIQGVVLKGVDSDFDWSFFEKHLVEGRSFQITEKKSKEILISQEVANQLKLKLNDKVRMAFFGKTIRQRIFTIVGIYNTSFNEMDKMMVLCDIKQVQSLNRWSEDQISGFEVKTKSLERLDLTQLAIFNEIGMPLQEDGSIFKIHSITETYRHMFTWLELQDLNVWILLILILAVTGINMISGILILLLERVQMIGILKALGATNAFIRKIFLYQSFHIIVKAAFWGNIFGFGLALIQKFTSIIKLNPDTYNVDSVPIEFPAFLLIGVNLAVVVTILVLLLLPSLIISGIQPAKTIRFQ